MSIWCDIAVSDVHFLICQVVDDCLEVTTGEAWEDVGYSQFCTDLSVVFLQQLCLCNIFSTRRSVKLGQSQSIPQ